MSKFVVKVEHIEAMPEYQIDADGLRDLLTTKLGISDILLWDYWYYYVSHENWGKIFADILLNMPKYTTEKFDCEDFAMLTTTRILEKYKLNTCGIAIGASPWGRHGYNIFLSEAGLFYLEPQTGDIYSIEEDSGYRADLIIMG